MQTANAAPRDDLTADEVWSVITCESVTVTPGLELWDVDEEESEDISDDLVGGTVARANFADVHGTCRLDVSRALEWGSARLAPYVVLTDNLTGARARFNLGVYLPETPDTPAGEDPVTYTVEGYDKLTVLRTPIGRAWSALAGSDYLTAIAELIEEAGESKYLLDPTSTKTLPVDYVAPLDDAITYLSVINDLLAAIGYRGLWVDWDGYYRSEPYVSPTSRDASYTYDAESPTTILGLDRVEVTDLHDIPNRWVFVNTSRDPTSAAVEGDGVYTVVNQSNGPTSIDARGREKSKVIPVDAADQEALVVYGDRVAQNAQQSAAVITLTTEPSPLHWHMDVVALADPALPPSPRKCLVGRWTLPLTGGQMTHEWRTV